MPQSTSTRWCPTPEQLMLLEDMYRSGIKTPNATQIQHITAHLSCYGRIESKNVFYWFQNHKARDRQKLKKRLNRHQNILLQQQQQHPQILLHPPPPPLQYPYLQAPPQLFHQGGCAEVASPVMNLDVKKMEACGRESDSMSMMGSGGINEWMLMMDNMGSIGTALSINRPPPPPPLSPPPPCGRPLKILELFPTTSTAGGLKEECYCSTSNSKSSTY